VGIARQKMLYAIIILMKKFLIIVLILAVAIGIGLVAGQFIKNKKNGISLTALFKTTSKTPATPKFVWGVQGGAYVLNQMKDAYIIEHVESQIKSLKDLGVNTVRANLELKRQDSPFLITPQETANDDFIARLSQAGLDTVLVLDPDVPKTIGNANYEQEGYKLSSYAAKRYKDKVKYYQVLNEVSGTIAKPGDYKGKVIKGENSMEYSQERYDAVLGWAKGMIRGIRENDPNAKIVLCGHWIMYDIIGKLISDGINPDIIGWSWYSPDGLDVTKREYNWGNYINLAEKLSEFKKDLWIIESNSDHGSYFDGKISAAEGEKKQADFISNFAKNVYDSKYFKGYFVFNLADSPVAVDMGSPQDAHWGLVEVKEINGDYKITKYKPAFYAYHDFILSHLALPF